MGLTNECRAYVGKRVLIEPIYGWGWAFGPESSGYSYDLIEQAGAFHAVISRLFEWNGELRGGVATVRESGHVLDGALVSFWARGVGEWNFTSRPTHFSINVGEREITDHGGGLHAVGRPDLQGFAAIRDDAAGT